MQNSQGKEQGMKRLRRGRRDKAKEDHWRKNRLVGEMREGYDRLNVMI